MGPFQDHTSNQLIVLEALKSLKKSDTDQYHDLLESVVKDARVLYKEGLVASTTERISITEEANRKRDNDFTINGTRIFETSTVPSIAVQVLTVYFSSKMRPYIRGMHHIQTSPTCADNADETVKDALQLVAISWLAWKNTNPILPSNLRLVFSNHSIPILSTFRHGIYVSPSRISIKIPCTFSGLQACYHLSYNFGVTTLATIVFSPIQARLAVTRTACAYIAPYINELRVHIQPEISVDKHAVDTAIEFVGLATKFAQEYRLENEANKAKEGLPRPSNCNPEYIKQKTEKENKAMVGLTLHREGELQETLGMLEEEHNKTVLSNCREPEKKDTREKGNSPPHIMPASLVSIDEILLLVADRPDRITISLPLLQELAETPYEPQKHENFLSNLPKSYHTSSYFKEKQEKTWNNVEDDDLENCWQDEIAFNAALGDEAHRKLLDALAIFTDAQKEIESIISLFIAEKEQ